MRMLLTDSFPPECPDGETISANTAAGSGTSAKKDRIFSAEPVLAPMDNFWEVGVEGTVIAAPSALPAPAADALARGMAIPTGDVHLP